MKINKIFFFLNEKSINYSKKKNLSEILINFINIHKEKNFK